ncbi:hypothetical protein A6U95_25330 [Serratia sp. 14-2641]|nr:hypothetical protein A6U95_25330 [Serratia sp. 14-2641]
MAFLLWVKNRRYPLTPTFSHSTNREHQEHQCEQPGVVGELVPLQDAGSKKKDGILRRNVSGLDRFSLLGERARVRGRLPTKQTKDSLLTIYEQPSLPGDETFSPSR